MKKYKIPIIFTILFMLIPIICSGDVKMRKAGIEVLLMIIIPVAIYYCFKYGYKYIPLIIKYNKSNYRNVSGNGLLKTLFDKGACGEFLIFCIMENMGENYILTNVYLPLDNNKTTEIDLIVINRTGIYVIESKNFNGDIYGSENSSEWTQCFNNNRKEYPFYNPIKQNQGHIDALNKYLDYKYSDAFYSYIVFGPMSNISGTSYSSPNLSVIRRGTLDSEYKLRISTRSDILSHEDIREIYSKLQMLTHADEETKIKHINEIKSKYRR